MSAEVLRSRRDLRSDGPWVDPVLAVILALATLCLYAATLLPDVGAGDIAEFQRAAPTLGLAHPTGYPLYMLLGWLWSRLPLGGTVAWRMNLLSAVLGAAANGVLYLCGRSLGQLRPVAFATALAQGAALTFWKQATITEVYALAALLQSSLYLSLWRWRGGRGRLAVAGALCGLALVHHRTAIFLLPGVVLFIALTRRPARRELLSALVALAAAGLFYLYVPLRMTPELRSWNAVWDYITGRSLASAGLDPSRLLAELPIRVGELLQRYMLPQLTAVGAGVALLGAVALRRDRASAALLLTAHLLTVGFSAAYYVYDAEVFLTQAHVVAALLFGEGVMVLVTWSAGRAPNWKALPALLGALALALPLTLAARNEPLVRKANRDVGSFPVRAIMAQPLANNALMLVDWWYIYEELRYLQEVEGQRRDIELVPSGDGSELIGVVEDALRKGRAVYLLRPQPGLALAQHLEGQVWRVDSGSARLVIERPLDVHWANGVTLTGYTLADVPYRGGQVVPLTLAWRNERPLTGPLMVFVHLIGPDHEIWGQQDYLPARLVGGDVGQVQLDLAGPILSLDAPPGIYQVNLGWYDVSTLRRFALVDADGRAQPSDYFTLPTLLEIVP